MRTAYCSNLYHNKNKNIIIYNTDNDTNSITNSNSNSIVSHRTSLDIDKGKGDGLNFPQHRTLLLTAKSRILERQISLLKIDLDEIKYLPQLETELTELENTLHKERRTLSEASCFVTKLATLRDELKACLLDLNSEKKRFIYHIEQGAYDNGQMIHILNINMIKEVSINNPHGPSKNDVKSVNSAEKGFCDSRKSSLPVSLANWIQEIWPNESKIRISNRRLIFRQFESKSDDSKSPMMVIIEESIK